MDETLLEYEVGVRPNGTARVVFATKFEPGPRGSIKFFGRDERIVAVFVEWQWVQEIGEAPL